MMSRLMRSLVFVLATAFASPLSASVDVSVSAQPSRIVPVGGVLNWTLYVHNEGPDPANDVTVSTNAPGLEPSTPCGADAHFAAIASLATEIISCSARLPQMPGDIVISSSATTTSEDRNPLNNRIDVTLHVTNATNLLLYLTGPRAADAAFPFVYSVNYWNYSPVPATGAIIDITLPVGASYRSGPDFCNAADGNVTCRIGDLPASFDGRGGFSSFQINAIAPDVTQEQSITTTATIHADQPDSRTDVGRVYSLKTPLFRMFRVTNTADSGSGSLREAINSANASCTDNYPCKIAFAVPSPAIDGVQTIHPETPLPHLQGTNLVVDGGMQTALFGDSNPAGPEVQLLGDRLSEGDGLVIETSCISQIQGLTISGFPGAGIVVLDDLCTPPFNYSTPSEDVPLLPRTIIGNYLGTDPTGSRAVPNERGIVSAGTHVSPIRIDGNLISGNRRSGIFLASGQASLILGNAIGLDPSRKVPLGNGASGIYIGPDAYATDVSDNMIAFNHHSGVSVAAAAVQIQLNSIFANGQLAIDLGLDGPTAALEGALLTSAHYDPTTGLTTIEGSVIGGVGILSSIVDFFANDALDPSGYGEAQYTLGETTTGSDRRHFIWSHPGDLRGKFITATVTRSDYFGFARAPRISPDFSWQGFVTTTSEVSRAIPVQ
jgi:hypothetical protein